MKRATLKACVLPLLIFAFTSTGFAQEVTDDTEQPNIDVGVGLVYGSEIESLGLTVDAYYVINEQFRAGGGLTYFFPEDTPGARITWFAVDLNAQYLLYAETDYSIYGLGGINIVVVSTNFDDEFFEDASESEIGLNLGAGIEYGLNFADFFGELKLAGLFGDADQLVLTAGLRFDI